MRLAVVYSRASVNMKAPLVRVEVHLSNGLPKLNIVGLPEKAVKESKDRVRSAILNSQFDFPCRYITVNLAPADLPKEGGRFDLPIALGILVASHQLPAELLQQYEFIGELALTGEIRPVKAILPAVLGSKQANRQLIIPQDNAKEAAIVKESMIYAASHLLDVCAHLKNQQILQPITHQPPKAQQATLDMADVKGQPHAKRALEIAASGMHNLLLVGSPGTGKSMLAMRLPSILPRLNEDQAIEVAAIHSMSKKGFDADHWTQLPFRNPHHTASNIALVGGGRPPQPGEISLAHHGILFLDELPEFSRAALESLREPLETGQITISRAGIQQAFPARFQFITALNPCPCGYAGETTHLCECRGDRIKHYLGKISGPLLDRIDMQIHVQRLPEHLLLNNHYAEPSSADISSRVSAARERQYHRQQKLNAHLNLQEVKMYCALKDDSQTLLLQIAKKLSLSARVIHRLLKVSRTIADLNAHPEILAEDLTEVFQYRAYDRIKSTIY